RIAARNRPIVRNTIATYRKTAPSAKHGSSPRQARNLAADHRSMPGAVHGAVGRGRFLRSWTVPLRGLPQTPQLLAAQASQRLHLLGWLRLWTSAERQVAVKVAFQRGTVGRIESPVSP